MLSVFFLGTALLSKINYNYVTHHPVPVSMCLCLCNTAFQPITSAQAITLTTTLIRYQADIESF